MNTEKGFIKKRFILAIPFLFIVLGGGFGGWLLSAEQKTGKLDSREKFVNFNREKKMYKKLWQYAKENEDNCTNPYILVSLAPYGPGIINMDI